METQLLFSIGGTPQFSSRGCMQELKPLVKSPMLRSLNGNFIKNIKPVEMKYISTITCKDEIPFAFDGIYPGVDVSVGCITPLIQKITSDKMVLSRDYVNGSLVAYDMSQKKISIKKVDGRNVFLSEKSGFLSYRPWMKMKVVDFEVKTNEWDMKNFWVLKLEEG
jgi:hypothetical protein